MITVKELIAANMTTHTDDDHSYVYRYMHIVATHNHSRKSLIL